MCINGPLYTYRISANIFLRWTVSAVWWDNYEFKFAFYEKKIIDETTLYEIFLTLSNKFVLRGHCLRNYGMLYYLTLLGLGLIKINYVSANFINPRPSLILNN